MGRRSALAAILLAMAPAAAAAQYETPVNPPDPAAQLAELIELYDAVCLHAFPDDRAAAQALDARGGTELSPAQVRIYLHEDPGRGWDLRGRYGLYHVTIEAPPFHACGIRTLTAAGFPDMAPYRALADRFEAGGGYATFPSVTREIDNVQVSGGGERRVNGARAESLMVIMSTPTDKTRDAAHSAVEVRFVHQIHGGD